MKFTASLDNTARIISGLILAFPLVFIFLQKEAVWVTIFLEAIFFTCFTFAPLNYRLTDSELIIKRLFKPVHISLAEIKTVKKIPEGRKMAKGTIRTFGVGGLYGYFGKFWNKEFGKMTWYLTNFKHVIAIETKAGETILISPDEAEMISILKEKLISRQPQAA